MNKLKVLMSVLLAATIFAACSSDDDVTPVLKFDSAAVEVAVEGETVVTVTEGTAPFTITISEDAAKIIGAPATSEDGKITFTGVAEGEVTIVVTDKDGIKGEVKVTVTAKDEEGDDSEGDDTEGDDTEGEE